MKIIKVDIENFRLLDNISISFEEIATLVVGRNNSGKTSLTEIFFNFFQGETPSFKFEDFSIKCHPRFLAGLTLYKKYLGANEDEKDQILQDLNLVVPTIKLDIHISYEKTDDGKLSSLSDFIMDLDKNRRDAMIRCVYSPRSIFDLYKEYQNSQKEYSVSLIEFLRTKHRLHYECKFYAIDKEDNSNAKEIKKRTAIEYVILCDFIGAQRQLDDQSRDGQRSLSRSFEDFYGLQKKLQTGDIKKIEELLRDFASGLEDQYGKLFENVLNDLKTFGVKDGININPLKIKALFDGVKIIKGNAQIFYNPDPENLLPEAYNGLGYSNLIYMILRFITFYEKCFQNIPTPNIHLIFIEEPEAHLHPQMQQIFVKNIKDFISSRDNWNVQLVITTHSSHVLEASDFHNIRYFDNSSNLLIVKNLNDYQVREKATEPETIKFLKQYMTLKNCDMFFADKIIMVEGVVERLVLPLMISKTTPKLNAQYISIIEIGGAYAHRFKNFLEFIGVKTLIITDLDSVNSEGKKCCVKDGVKSSNAVLGAWLPKEKDISKLLAFKPKQKLSSNERIRVTYQIAELVSKSSLCGRSFEEAFIICNSRNLAGKTVGELIPKLFQSLTIEAIENQTYELAGKIGDRKTEFAFDIMLLDNWNVPKYIEEGLIWLEK